MPRIVDTAEIRARLLRDPAWAVYALCDLAPHMLPKTEWFEPDLTLLLHDYGTCILFSTGPASVREALDHATWPIHLQVQANALREVERYARVVGDQSMWRMVWSRRDPTGSTPDNVRCLGVSDVPALLRLYDDGVATGEAPDFFMPEAVQSGFFHGAFDGVELLAAAGTHVVAEDEGAATVGNVYVRRDCRGRGLGRMVTTAVLGALAHVPIVGLNVRDDNAGAIALYESLGFSRHCRFHEAVATGWLTDTDKAGSMGALA